MTFSGFGFRAPRCRSCNSVQGYTVESSFNSHLFLYSHRIAHRQRFFSETHIRGLRNAAAAGRPPASATPLAALLYGFTVRLYIYSSSVRFTFYTNSTRDTRHAIVFADCCALLPYHRAFPHRPAGGGPTLCRATYSLCASGDSMVFTSWRRSCRRLRPGSR